MKPTAVKRDLDQWLAWIEGQHPRAIDMGLERVREVHPYPGLKLNG